MSVNNKFVVSDRQMRRNFERILKDALELGVPPFSESGLDNQVVDAIAEVALHFPNGKRLEDAARKAFEAQLARDAV